MYIKVKAHPGSKKERIEQKSKDSYIIKVREEAKNNQANKRIVEILARKLRIPSKKIRIINGHHRPNKLIRIIESN